MYCTHCGKELPEEESFCIYCGAKVGEAVQEEEKTKDFFDKVFLKPFLSFCKLVFTGKFREAVSKNSKSEGFEWIWMFLINIFSFAAAATVNECQIFKKFSETIIKILNNSLKVIRISFNPDTVNAQFFRVVFPRSVLISLFAVIITAAVIFVCAFLQKKNVGVLKALNVSCGASVFTSAAFLPGIVLGLLSPVLFAALSLCGIVFSFVFLYESLCREKEENRKNGLIFVAGVMVIVVLVFSMTVFTVGNEIEILMTLIK